MTAAEHVVDVAADPGLSDPGLAAAMEHAGTLLLRFLSEEASALDFRSGGPAPEFEKGGGALELSILLTDNAGIQKLNLQWRQVDAATDVLSFPLGAGQALGDVVLSVETAESRVDDHWRLDDELTFLLIHGLLHLLGHDHESDDERVTMEAAEQRMWTALGRTGTLRAPEPGTT